jgi:hypothetical protein
MKIMRLQLERTVRECKEPGSRHVNHAILILKRLFAQQKFAARHQQAVAVVERSGLTMTKQSARGYLPKLKIAER